MLEAGDTAGAMRMREQQEAAAGEAIATGSGEDTQEMASDTENSSVDEDKEEKAQDGDIRVLKLLYKGQPLLVSQTDSQIDGQQTDAGQQYGQTINQDGQTDKKQHSRLSFNTRLDNKWTEYVNGGSQRETMSGNIEEISRRDQQDKRAGIFNIKHNCYRHTRCTSTAQEEQSALPAGVINVNEDSDDGDCYLGEQKELQKEQEALRHVQQWINQEGWDVASEVMVESPKTGHTIDLRLQWNKVKYRLAEGNCDGQDDETEDRKDPSKSIDEDVILRDYSLEKLDPVQRAFADRVLKWGNELADKYEHIKKHGTKEDVDRVPKLRTFLGGSAGSGKSTTLKTCVQHLRLLFYKRKVDAKVSLTAYTGVAAFNIGFGARTACSAFHVFPNAAWKNELDGATLRRLEDTWRDVVLLIVDEISFIGQAFFVRMHFRLQQAKREHFSKYAIDPHKCTFGDISLILVGDFGQLEPIDDWSLCDAERRSHMTSPKRLKHLWKHAWYGQQLIGEFKEAIMLKQIHRSKDDMWWTQSCLRLRDFTCTKAGDYDVWRQHDLDLGHFDEEQKKYFEDEALWLCARCEDVGQRNGRKLARLAEGNKELIHQIKAEHSHKSAKKLPSSCFDGLRERIHLVRGCKVVLTRNVAYRYGLANGTRGNFIGAVYGPGGVGSFPEALIAEFPDYCGDPFYEHEPKWVPILPILAFKQSSRMTRTQFPLVAGFALTVNKAQGLTVKEGVVIHLVGGQRFRPASKHGLPFVAFTRSESFAMTAFKHLPPWDDFVKGRESDMLRMRNDFTAQLDAPPA